ncbi:MAG: HsdR family type I site-specific deoxyribonuclease, partial [Actinobacteria bacterium]|nr:HsdR family type I site-specific deoxyribonuclease [Actinomycetota bacterium]
AKTILKYYKFGVPVKFEHDKVLRNVQLFDYNDPNNNEYIVSRQVYFHGRDFIRTDIILYINGIPLVNIECKNPASITESWFDAYKQILKYQNIVPELYKYIQIGIAAERVARYFPVVVWREDVTTYQWRAGNKSNENTEVDPIESMTEILPGQNLLDIIKNFLFFRAEKGEADKIITRYMQYRAANKIVRRIKEKLANRSDRKRGLIWHWQGSGKTFTMIFAANKLYYLKELSNPTVFFIVDRNELETQLNDEFNYLDIVEPEKINSVFELKRVLKHDDYRGKRGIFITLIHKFRPEELADLQDEIEKISKFKETIANRENVIVFIDEGHRTQYGLLAAQMKKIFKSAFFFALTGTPISKTGKDTYLEYAYPPEEIYLDKYFISDSIKDKYTVKIVYQPRLIESVHLNKEMLEEFLKSELEEIPDTEEYSFDFNYRGKIEEKIKDKLNLINSFLENPERINLVAKDIAEHFKRNIDGKFKALIVAASRKACLTYKNVISKYLPEEYSEIVMTHTVDDSEPLLERVAEIQSRFGTKKVEDINK